MKKAHISRFLRTPPPLFVALATLGLILLSAHSGGAPATAATPPEAATSAPASTLSEQQNLVRDRLQRLEGLMLKLSRALEESEPDKAERLRDTLEQVGQRRVRTRADRLVALLREGKLSDASRDQEALLADLDAMLELLISNESVLDRRRAERQRLEQLKRAVRTLLDEQAERLSRTQSAAKDDPNALEGLEDAQRETQRRTQDLNREMQPKAGESRTPGTEQTERAAEHMQRAADRLGEHQQDAAEQEQQQALRNLQQAVDELEDALRQVRREEMEQTLAALEARFRAMLDSEKQVRSTVVELAAKDRGSWSRTDQLRLADATETQRKAGADCAAVERILVDEGTTVILPELVAQLAEDMNVVLLRLEESDPSAETQAALDSVIGRLEEIIAAVESRREQQEQADQQQQQPAGERGSQPLLPGSTELKLLRGWQQRLNQRTAALASEASGLGELTRLAERQRRLADLTRRMHEKQ